MLTENNFSIGSPSIIPNHLRTNMRPLCGLLKFISLVQPMRKDTICSKLVQVGEDSSKGYTNFRTPLRIQLNILGQMLTHSIRISWRILFRRESRQQTRKLWN